MATAMTFDQIFAAWGAANDRRVRYGPLEQVTIEQVETPDGPRWFACQARPHGEYRFTYFLYRGVWAAAEVSLFTDAATARREALLALLVGEEGADG